MQFAAALVEYLACGFVALLWLVPLVTSVFHPDGPVPLSDSGIALYLPIAYVIGVYLDGASGRMLRRWRFHGSSQAPYDRTTRILSVGSVELVKTMSAYVGRDRIARGVLLNALIAIIVFPATLAGSTRWVAEACAVIVFATSVFVWKHFDRLSSEFKENAVRHLERRMRANETLQKTGRHRASTSPPVGGSTVSP